MDTSLEQRIVNLEQLLGGRVSTEFESSPLKKSKIDPLATIYVCRPSGVYKSERYLTIKENHNRDTWADISSPYYVIVEYFGKQENFSDVMKITVSDRNLSSCHIYSPDLDELIYSDNILEDCFGKHLLLKRHINLSRVYKELTDTGIKVETNSENFIKSSLKP